MMKAALYYVPAYVLLDWLSYLHPVLPLAITPWNPPPGLSLALLLLYGLRQWPWLFVAALLAELLVRDVPVSWGWLAAAAAAPALCYGGLAAVLLRVARIDPRLGALRDLTWLIGGALAAALLAGLAYVGVYTLAGVAVGGEFPANVLRFWIGDVSGLLVTAPLLLALAARQPWKARPDRETWLQAASLLLVLWIIFGIEFTDEFKFFYLLFLPMVWIATRHGLLGATLALALIQLGVIGFLQLGGHHARTVMEFQMLMLGLTVTGLFLGISVSIRQAAEDRLHQRESDLNRALRVAAAGELTQALAHELNQPLAAVANYARAGQMMLAGPQRHDALLADTLGKIAAEAGRAGEVVHTLREFFGGGRLHLEACAVAQLVEEGLAPLIKRAERREVALRTSLPDGLPAVRADRVQIGTVILNLVGNALDALDGAGRTKPEVEINAERTARGMIRICVSDNGAGLAPEMRERLFQPFATSKVDGMGLGLAISRTLVEAHGGTLTLEGKRPTRFCFTLPIEPAGHPDQEATRR